MESTDGDRKLFGEDELVRTAVQGSFEVFKKYTVQVK